MNGEDACIARVSAAWSTGRSMDTFTDMLRFDVIAKKAEVVTSEPRAPVRKLTCQLQGPPK